MNSHQMTGLKIMLACSLIAALSSTIWTLIPLGTDSIQVETKSDAEPIDSVTRNSADHPVRDGFQGMELWTKPPTAPAPPPQPPPKLQLNADILAIRETGPGVGRVATLYLNDTGELLRMKKGDIHDGMTVAEITESTIRFVRGSQSLIISREYD